MLGGAYEDAVGSDFVAPDMAGSLDADGEELDVLYQTSVQDVRM